jgi:hypothetical protein
LGAGEDFDGLFAGMFVGFDEHQRFIITSAGLERGLCHAAEPTQSSVPGCVCVVVQMVKELDLSLAVEKQTEVVLARILAVPVLQFPDSRTSVLHSQ